MNTLVSDLRLGDKVCLGKAIVQVREVMTDRVIVSKITAEHGHGLMSIRFYTHEYEDLINRIERV
jgi:hypothetical protein